MRKSKDSYVCRYCGYVLPKKDAIVSGWDSESSLRHVHCTMDCGRLHRIPDREETELQTLHIETLNALCCKTNVNVFRVSRAIRTLDMTVLNLVFS